MLLSPFVVEMLDIEIQTDEQLEPVAEHEDNLIRLQSSMSMLQEDFNRERKMLNDQIAKLQAQVVSGEKIKENVEAENLQQRLNDLDQGNLGLPTPIIGRAQQFLKKKTVKSIVFFNKKFI